jgi:lipopolysaccharide transport system permease protein
MPAAPSPMTRADVAVLTDIRDMVREQVEFRELFYQLIARDLRLRYKQTVMGFGWAVFVPLLNTIVFSVVFTRVAPIDTRVPYPVFAYCGLLVWNLTASALRFAVTSLTSNANLVAKVYFPREIFPLAAVAVSLVDFAVAGLGLLAFMIYYGVPATPMLLLLPGIVAVQVAFTSSLALLLSMANLFYRDIKYLIDAVLNVWMFASAVVYPLDGVRGAIGLVLRLNPMTVLIDAYRSVLLFGTAPPWASFAWVLILSAAMLPAAWWLFHRLEFRFAENV